MKEIILIQTIKLYPDPGAKYQSLIDEGYELRKINDIIYMIK